MNATGHILVIFERSAAGARALRDAAAIADEHGSRISVVSVISYECRTIGCCMPAGRWNQILDEIAIDEIGSAREILGERDPAPRFEIVPDAGAETVPNLVERLGCDLVLKPTRRWFGTRSVRRLRQSVPIDVLGVRAA